MTRVAKTRNSGMKTSKTQQRHDQLRNNDKPRGRTKNTLKAIKAVDALPPKRSLRIANLALKTEVKPSAELTRNTRSANQTKELVVELKETGRPKRNAAKQRNIIANSVGGPKQSNKQSERSISAPTEKKRKTSNGCTKTLGTKLPFVQLTLSAHCENILTSDGVLSTYPSNGSSNGQAASTSTALFKIPDARLLRIQTSSIPVKTGNSNDAPEFEATNRTFRARRQSTSIQSVRPIIRRKSVAFVNSISEVDLTKQHLHQSEPPMTLPGREKEFTEISEMIRDKILNNSSGCIYICGVPGSGKTVTITKVIQQLQSESFRYELPPFDLIQVNGMQLTGPHQVFVHICRHLTDNTVRWDEAIPLLDKYFGDRSVRKTTILVVDEFDMLRSPGQRVIYNLLNWVTKPSSRLVLVAVGNFVDAERMGGGVASRLGATRLTFLPYTQNQLQNIVLARLAGKNVCERDAIEFIARKIASISGDCRRALDICRRAIEIGEKDCAGRDVVITMSHVTKTFDDMITNPRVIAIKSCSRMEKLFLQGVVAALDLTGTDETVLYKAYQQFETICRLNGVTVPEPGIALRMSSRLGASRLLICDHSKEFMHQKIMLNFTDYEMRYALDH